MRKHWIDNLKWLCILCVVLFHISCMFNSCGMPLGVGTGLPTLDLMGYFTYPWIMALMFLLAGISARYALEKRTIRTFLGERAKRLLLPLLATLILIAPLLCSFTWRVSGVGFAQMMKALPLPVVCLIALLSGMGPQWFLPALYLYSLALLPLRTLAGRGRRRQLWDRAGWVGFPLTALLFWLSSAVLPVPDRYAAYFAAFLMGYLVFSREIILEKLKKARFLLLAAAGIFFLLSTPRYCGASFSGSAFLSDPVTALFAWSFCLAALGSAQVWLARPHPFWTERGFSIFLFHYLPMLVTAFYTSQWGWPSPVKYTVTLAAALGVPLLLHKILCRIPPLRTAFGLSGPSRPGS